MFSLCCCFLSRIGVVFLTSPEPSSAVLALYVDGFLFHLLLLLCVVSNGLSACFCHKMTFYQPGEYDHSVLYTTAQLTEGRSARDQPKQPPAKKLCFAPFLSCALLCSFLSCTLFLCSALLLSPAVLSTLPYCTQRILHLALMVFRIQRGDCCS